MGGRLLPQGLTYEGVEPDDGEQPEEFHKRVQESLRRQVAAINKLTAEGMYFFDYGNAFLLESSRAGADCMAPDGKRFPLSLLRTGHHGPDVLRLRLPARSAGRTSGRPEDLATTDRIALEVMRKYARPLRRRFRASWMTNILWISKAGEKQSFVVGSQARILYADARRPHENRAGHERGHRPRRNQRPGRIGPRPPRRVGEPTRPTAKPQHLRRLLLPRRTWPYRTSSATRSAERRVSLHNGGGVGWGEVVNGGFGMVIDGSGNCRNIREMLFWMSTTVSPAVTGRNEGMDAIQLRWTARPTSA